MAFVFTVGAHFIIVPFVIASIGLDGFGRAGLVLAAWAPLLVIGTVIGQAVTREVAVHLVNGDRSRVAQNTSVALMVCALCCAIGGTLFVAGGPYLLQWLGPSESGVVGWRSDVVALAPGWLAQQFALVLLGVVSARQDFQTIARISALNGGASVALTLGLTSLFPSTAGYLVGVSCSQVVSALVVARYSCKSSNARLLAWEWNGDALKTLLHFGKWQAVTQIVGTFGNQVDRYVLATLASPAVIGQFNAANRLQEAAYVGVVKAAEVLFPRFGASSLTDLRSRARLYLAASWGVMLFSGVILAPMIALSEPLLRLWAGREVADGGAFLLRTLVLGGLIGCGSNVFSYYLMGIGKTAPLAVISLAYSALTIVLSVILLRTFGPMAAGAGLALASLARVLLALTWGKFCLFPFVGWGELLVSTVLPMVVALGVSAAWMLAVPNSRIDNWWCLGGAFIAVMILVLSLVLALTGLSAFGRGVLRQLESQLRAARVPLG